MYKQSYTLHIENEKLLCLFVSYLHVSGDSYGRPIHGQREVSGYSSPSELNYWKAMEGIFVKPLDENSMDSEYSHDEF